ncbi:hypothetical protein TREMEDRAFT_42037 [Tremella mesenterica DSM 1558]|uniref:uncharacterized protein n=1 Tax=Tremella mesenterica (strain ATCC 24925 / CBS 8224 / DSM 1558 / NBRC 9311 / NRRL Y-6157 / RJB 2259-6 / UBC 559-6) TaxID=578456 RepID=UPI0003F49F69|nr:uncharacterized protein TREMEDRAFT_42037 [Tremella mesenterica DSM 1558]EIW72864.1 hypothetical protein TREMEDRAFT_42037 [Tremella mesenterica DSM 1558]
MMRPALPPFRLAGRRYASSSPLTNPQVQRALELASTAAQQTAATVQRVSGPVGARVGSALGSYREPLTFNAKVFASLCRQVYIAERLAPPLQLSTWANAYAKIWHSATSLTFWRSALSSGAWAGLGIAAVETYGLFCLGEMIGRLHLVGYALH